MDIEEARKIMKMSRREISDWLGIPYRTLCAWACGERECPAYMERLIVEKILGGKKKMTFYELRRRTEEISWKDRKQISKGCTAADPEPDTIKRFNTKKEALEALKAYTTTIRELKNAVGVYYAVEEYCVEENEYNEEDEWVDGGNIWAWSEMKIEIVEKPTYDTLAVCSTYAEAESVLNNYDGENEVFISL